jgi:hypothetical protein
VCGWYPEIVSLVADDHVKNSSFTLKNLIFFSAYMWKEAYLRLLIVSYRKLSIKLTRKIKVPPCIPVLKQKIFLTDSSSLFYEQVGKHQDT